MAISKMFVGKGGNSIQFDVGFNVDKTSLGQVKAQLKELQNMNLNDFMSLNKNLKINDAREQLNLLQHDARKVEEAFTSAFNVNLGSINISKLSQELNKLDLRSVYTNFQKAGSAGTAAFNQISSAVMRNNLQLKESNHFLDKMAVTFANTARFGVASSVFNRITDSIRESWEYTVKLDTSLNDIRIVSDKSADSMARFAKEANAAAKELGANTLDYTRGALTYFQQGLDDEQTRVRTRATVMATNATTGISSDEMADNLTAVWNGYKVQSDEVVTTVDKLAKVAATTAADLGELSTGMSKVASAANVAGVDIDQLNAMLATVISVTREAPETVGTAFKTIFARIGDLTTGGKDEEGIGLGKVSKQLDELGVHILDETGNMRAMGNVIEDIAAKWDTWTAAEKQAVAVATAGKMQYSRFMTLFENWDMYQQSLQDSVDSVGYLQKQQDIYMESTQAHLNQLQTAWDRFADSFVDNKGANSIIDIFTGAITGVAEFTEALGGRWQCFSFSRCYWSSSI